MFSVFIRAGPQNLPIEHSAYMCPRDKEPHHNQNNSNLAGCQSTRK